MLCKTVEYDSEVARMTSEMYESVTQTAQRYGLPRRTVLEFCNARGQKFAFKPNGGKFWIHRQGFKEYLERKRKGI